MDAIASTRRHFAGAWAVLLGAFLILAGGSIGAVVDHANLDALLGLWLGFTALQLLVLTVLVVIEHRQQRAHWGMAIPLTIVVAQVVAGMSAFMMRARDNAESGYAAILF